MEQDRSDKGREPEEVVACVQSALIRTCGEEERAEAISRGVAAGAGCLAAAEDGTASPERLGRMKN